MHCVKMLRFDFVVLLCRILIISVLLLIAGNCVLGGLHNCDSPRGGMKPVNRDTCIMKPVDRDMCNLPSAGHSTITEGPVIWCKNLLRNGRKISLCLCYLKIV